MNACVLIWTASTSLWSLQHILRFPHVYLKEQHLSMHPHSSENTETPTHLDPFHPSLINHINFPVLKKTNARSQIIFEPLHANILDCFNINLSHLSLSHTHTLPHILSPLLFFTFSFSGNQGCFFEKCETVPLFVKSLLNSNSLLFDEENSFFKLTSDPIGILHLLLVKHTRGYSDTGAFK